MNRWASCFLSLVVLVGCAPAMGSGKSPSGTSSFKGKPIPPRPPWDKKPPPQPSEKQIYLIFRDKQDLWSAVLLSCEDSRAAWAASGDPKSILAELTPLVWKSVVVDLVRRPPPPPQPDGGDDNRTFAISADAACAANGPLTQSVLNAL